MRRAYNRSGLGIVALYGIFSIASTVLLGLFAGVGIGIRITQNLNIFELIADSGIFAFSEILRYIYEDPMISIFVMAGMVAGSAAGMLIGIPIMRKILPKENPKPIEDRKLTGPEFLRIILMAFGLWGVGVAIGNLPAFLGYDVANPLLENAGNALILYLIYAVVGAPILEELAFRKYLINALHPYGSVPAAFVSATLFGLMHGNAAQFLLAFSLGMLLGTVYQKTGRVIYTICLHFMINLFGTLPDFLMLVNIDITTVWYIVFGVLTAAGVVTVILSRKWEFLKLDRPVLPDANRQAFRNPGMLIALIGGLVLVAGYELLNLVNFLMGGYELGVMIRLFPLALTILTVILVMTTVGRHTDPYVPETGAEEYPPYVPAGYPPYRPEGYPAAPVSPAAPVYPGAYGVQAPAANVVQPQPAPANVVQPQPAPTNVVQPQAPEGPSQ